MKNQSFTKALAVLIGAFTVCLLLCTPSSAYGNSSFLDCNTSPVITCPSNYFGCPEDDIHPDNTGYATAVAGEVGCEDPEVSYTDLVISEGPCEGQVLIKRIWLAEYPNDANPWLFAECTQIILLEDIQAPEIEDCPADITVDMNVSCDNPSWDEPYTVENCKMESFTSDYNSGDTFPEGTTTVTYIAVDACGNESSCSFDVTVIGQCCEAPPVIDCQPNAIICPGDDTDPDATGYPIVNVDPACGPYTLNYEDKITNNDSNCSGHPLIRRTWIVTYDDHPTLADSCLQKIIFRDNESPVFIFCPDDILIDNAGACEGVANWDMPNVTDNCGIQFLSSNFDSGDNFPTGDTEVIYSAVDNCGNVSTCIFVVTVIDNCCSAPPEIICPSNVFVCPGSDISPAVTGYPVVIPDNDCGPIWVSHSDHITNNENSCDGHPRILRTWTVKYEDYPDLMATCVQKIIFSDNQIPEFQACPQNMVFSTPQDVYWFAPTVTDNCNINSLTSNYTPNSNFPLGTTEVVYTAIDDCGNVATCSFTVTVEGSMLVLDCPDDITLNCGGELEDWQIYPEFSTTCNACEGLNELDGFIYMGSLNGHKYYCSLFPSTWEYAEDYCQQYGGHLAAINSAEENFLLSSFLTTQSAYIGFSDNDIEGEFAWSNGDPVTYTNWYPGQPNDYLDGQDHVEMLNNGQWNDQYPHKKLEFIMEIPCVSITQTGGPLLTEYLTAGEHVITYTASDACGNYATCSFTVTVEAALEVECPADVNVSCPYGSNGIIVNWNTPEVNTCCTSNVGGYLPGWIWMGEYNGSNYYCTLEPYTWDEGNALCHSYGGYLATINDQGENEFLANLLTIQSAYIGLNDIAQEGNFKWENGEPVSYTNWYPGQPNNFNGIQDHVEMLNNGQWNDQYYYKKLECIMEIPGTTTITQTSGPPSGSVFIKGTTTTISYLITDGCGNSETCSFEITVQGEDCSPTGMNSEACWIETVVVDTYWNTSGNDWGYGDYTQNCVQMEAGESYNIRLSPSCGNGQSKVYWSIYMDFNMDDDFFDSGEFVAYGSSSGQISGVLTLPYSIWNGEVTLRVMMHQGSYATGPCDSNGYGEIEDYCIQVIGANALPDNPSEVVLRDENKAQEWFGNSVELNVYPNPATDRIYFDNVDVDQIESIHVFNAQGKSVKTANLEVRKIGYLNVNDLDTGIYFLEIHTFDESTPITKRVIIN